MLPSSHSPRPRGKILVRLLLPTAVVFYLGVAIMGEIADPQVFHPRPIKSASGSVSDVPMDFESATRGGFRHWRTISFFLAHVPEVCWSDNAVNDFQKRQCAEF